MNEDYKNTGWRPLDTQVLVFVQRRWSNTRIADKLKLNPATVSKIRNSQTFQERLKDMNQRVAEKTAEKIAEKNAVDLTRDYLQSKMQAAARRIYKLSKEGSPRERLQFEAAKEILHLAGLTPKLQVENTTNEREYTEEEVLKALNVLNEIESTMQRLKNKDSQFYLGRNESDETALGASQVRQEESSEGPILPQ